MGRDVRGECSNKTMGRGNRISERGTVGQIQDYCATSNQCFVSLITEVLMTLNHLILVFFPFSEQERKLQKCGFSTGEKQTYLGFVFWRNWSRLKGCLFRTL